MEEQRGVYLGVGMGWEGKGQEEAGGARVWGGMRLSTLEARRKVPPAAFQSHSVGKLQGMSLQMKGNFKIIF